MKEKIYKNRWGQNRKLNRDVGRDSCSLSRTMQIYYNQQQANIQWKFLIYSRSEFS